MPSVAPWSVKGISPEARKLAKEAAQRTGMTLGQWLSAQIAEAAAAAPEARETPETPRALDAARVATPAAHAPSLDALIEQTEARVTAHLAAKIEALDGAARARAAAAEDRHTAQMGALDRSMKAMITQLNGRVTRAGQTAEQLAAGLETVSKSVGEGLARAERTEIALRRVADAIGALNGEIKSVRGAAEAARDAAAKASDPAAVDDRVRALLNEALAERTPEKTVAAAEAADPIVDADVAPIPSPSAEPAPRSAPGRLSGGASLQRALDRLDERKAAQATCEIPSEAGFFRSWAGAADIGFFGVSDAAPEPDGARDDAAEIETSPEAQPVPEIEALPEIEDRAEGLEPEAHDAREHDAREHDAREQGDRDDRETMAQSLAAAAVFTPHPTAPDAGEAALDAPAADPRSPDPRSPDPNAQALLKLLEQPEDEWLVLRPNGAGRAAPSEAAAADRIEPDFSANPFDLAFGGAPHLTEARRHRAAARPLELPLESPQEAQQEAEHAAPRELEHEAPLHTHHDDAGADRSDVVLDLVEPLAEQRDTDASAEGAAGSWRAKPFEPTAFQASAWSGDGWSSEGWSSEGSATPAAPDAQDDDADRRAALDANPHDIAADDWAHRPETLAARRTEPRAGDRPRPSRPPVSTDDAAAAADRAFGASGAFDPTADETIADDRDDFDRTDFARAGFSPDGFDRNETDVDRFGEEETFLGGADAPETRAVLDLDGGRGADAPPSAAEPDDRGYFSPSATGYRAELTEWDTNAEPGGYAAAEPQSDDDGGRWSHELADLDANENANDEIALEPAAPIRSGVLDRFRRRSTAEATAPEASLEERAPAKAPADAPRFGRKAARIDDDADLALGEALYEQYDGVDDPRSAKFGIALSLGLMAVTAGASVAYIYWLGA